MSSRGRSQSVSKSASNSAIAVETSTSTASESEKYTAEYFINGIVDKRFNKRKNRIEYRCQWDGPRDANGELPAEEDDTWVGFFDFLSYL